MKNVGWAVIVLLALSLVLPAVCEAGDTHVRGHWRDTDRDGVKDTYVDSYNRTTPNDSRRDNYGYPGNLNPNTGSTSTGNPYSYERGRSKKHSSFE